MIEIGPQSTQKLFQLLSNLNNNESFRKFLKKQCQKLNFEKKNIVDLTPNKVDIMYKNLQFKLNALRFSQKQKTEVENSLWMQNQLRIFVYLFCVHLFLNKKTISELNEEDYQYLHGFFPTKSREHLEYQVKLLVFKKNSKWTSQQAQIFEKIMKQNMDSKKWHYISREIFLRSQKVYFKTPKQCRQRWINHVDPRKIKGNWGEKQDYTILYSVLNFGKKWTAISKQLNQTRTQNCVKNRYNSLIKIYKKQYGLDLSEHDLMIRALGPHSLQATSKKCFSPNSEIQHQNQIERNKVVIDPRSSTLKVEQSLFKLQEKQKPKQNYTEERCFLEEQYRVKRTFENKETFDENVELRYILDESEEIQNVCWNIFPRVDNINSIESIRKDSFYFQTDDVI